MSRDHDYCVYIVTNDTNTVLNIGITSDLEGRLWEHSNGEGSKFTRKSHVCRLLFHEQFGDVHAAIAREKQLKGWTRAKKEALIRTLNPTDADLGVLLDRNGVCRQPEGPPAPFGFAYLADSVHSAQDDKI